MSCYTAAYGIAGCALRFSNVYGPGMQHKDSFVPRLMRAARDGHGVQVYGDGTQIRDLIHVDDIVSALLLAWRSRATGSTIIGAGESVTVNDIIAAARSVTGAAIPVEHIAAKPGEMPAVIVDISRARGVKGISCIRASRVGALAHGEVEAALLKEDARYGVLK